MFAIKRVLMPVDFSECSWSALEHAAMLGERLGAAVDVLHVWEPPRYIDMNRDIFVGGRNQTLGQFARGEAELEMDRFLAKLKACGSPDVEGTIESGAPHKIIVDAASSGYDLIVMGTHGRTGLSHLLLGSVAEKVIRQARCPVLTVRQPKGRQHRAASTKPAGTTRPTAPNLAKILVAVDFSDGSRAALAYAVDLADKLESAVDVLHVSAPPGFAVPQGGLYVGETREPLADVNRRQAEEQLNKLLEDFRSERRSIAGRIETGEMGDTIPAQASAGDYDLLVLGTHGRRGWAHLMLGSVAEQVVRRASCPVLTIRHGAGQ